jgi:subtilisin family serine protease
MLPMCTRVLAIAAVCVSSIGLAQAQVRLPTVELPQLPVVTDTLDRTLDTTESTLAGVDLRDLRRAQVQGLLRRHRDVLERDPNGEPVVRRELLAFEPTEQALELAQSAGFTTAREERMAELGTRIVVLLAPQRMTIRRALQRLRALDPQGTYDYNHVYTRSGSIGTTGAVEPKLVPSNATSDSVTRVGLIDGGVDRSHPVFVNSSFQMNGCGGMLVPSPHGTAVASLIAMQIPVGRLELFSADVYCDQPIGGSVTAIVGAFGWLARERVPVINVSLVGPPNRMLERVIQTMLQRGHVIVAAVGNDGPNAKPLYPAAYEGVVGITGVDGKERVLIEALRGPQVDFAAPGADITAAASKGAYAPVRGTSFAAPVVAALMAQADRQTQPGAAQQVIQRFAAMARDLGKTGFDPVYGYGLLAAKKDR